MSTENGRVPMILIHGAWLSARSWENFADYFGKRGFDVKVPQWPRKHGDVEELRASADELAGLGLPELIEHYENEIREMAAEGLLATVIQHEMDHLQGVLFVDHISPLKRNIEGDEVGKTAVYLLSDLSSGVTGENIHLDSGFSIVGL